jgi:pimeloyl-ACP methyl ester carboxylesterase
MLKSAPFRQEMVHFTDTGRGRAVLLIHGFLGSSAIWENTARQLSKSYRVICIDLPGHGQTPCFGYVHTMEMMATAVKAVTDHLRLKKYVLIGHSMGGYVALAFADLYPENMKGLCLYHSSAYPDGEEKKRDRLRAITLVKANKRIYTRQTITTLFSAKNLKYLKKEISFALDIAKRTSQRGIIAALHGMRDRKGRELLLGFVQYPVMMVIGEHDNVLPAESLLEQSEMIANRTILYLEHDGHFGFLESPLTSDKALRKFLRKCYTK